MDHPKVVAKYDLYFSPQAAATNTDESYYLMRFPSMRSQLDNCDNANDISLKFKPKSKRCRLEIDADTTSKSFSMDTARTIAAKSTPFAFDVDHVNKYFYTSTTVAVDDKQLMIGKITMDNNKMVLCPVNYILNMRPDFSHFDRKEESDIREELKAVTVKFAAPEKAGAYVRQTIVDESLMEEYKIFKYHSINSKEATLHRASFLKGIQEGVVKKKPDVYKDDTPGKGSSGDSETLLDIKPKIEQINSTTPATKATLPVSQGTTKQQDLKRATARIKECLMRAKVVSYEDICQYINRFNEGLNFTSDQILPTIESLAVLVQGNWVVKSEILYEDDGDSKNATMTEITGIPVYHLHLARDYLLWLFCDERKVSRVNLMTKLKLPDHDILDLLKQLAKFDNSDKMWEFRLPADGDFMQKHQDIVTRQKSLWKVRKSNKLGAFFP